MEACDSTWFMNRRKRKGVIVVREVK